MHIEQYLADTHLVLPAPIQMPAGIDVPVAWVRVYGERAYLSGHAGLAPDGTLAQPLGRVGAEVSLNAARRAARLPADVPVILAAEVALQP